MASKFPEQDILVKGVINTDTKKGTEWIQNLWTPNTTLEVRPGFGQVAQIDSTLSRFGDYNSSLVRCLRIPKSLRLLRHEDARGQRSDYISLSNIRPVN